MPAPKLSLGSWAFSFGPFAANPWSFERLCRYAADAGFDGVEINGFRPHPHHEDFASAGKRRELGAFISDLGLGISGYAPDFHHVPPALVPTSSYLDVIGSCLDFMHDLDVKVLRVDTVTPPDVLDAVEYQERFERLVATWRAAAELCKRADATLVWEYEPGFWLNKPSEVLRLVQQVDHEDFRVLFDTTHSYMGAVVGARHVDGRETLAGGLQEYARLLTPYIGHFHIMDSDGTLHGNETSTHTPFGRGCIDFPSTLKTLQPALRGLPWWCLDYCFCSTTENDARLGVPIVRALARGMETQ